MKYRGGLKYGPQVRWKWGEKVAFSCLLQAWEHNFFTSFSPNLGTILEPTPVVLVWLTSGGGRNFPNLQPKRGRRRWGRTRAWLPRSRRASLEIKDIILWSGRSWLISLFLWGIEGSGDYATYSCHKSPDKSHIHKGVILGPKINCRVGLVNCFFRVPLLYQPCCLLPCCQGKLGELTKKTVYQTYSTVDFGT